VNGCDPGDSRPSDRKLSRFNARRISQSEKEAAHARVAPLSLIEVDRLSWPRDRRVPTADIATDVLHDCQRRAMAVAQPMKICWVLSILASPVQ
jgi:hypothetical protein